MRMLALMTITSYENLILHFYKIVACLCLSKTNKSEKNGDYTQDDEIKDCGFNYEGTNELLRLIELVFKFMLFASEKLLRFAGC